ncbi:MAG TPA: transglycosylase domain-containing protein [Xanthobacteraceae bacterium]|jgi:penicillin-binding protein 1A|nr:transglycosylase domain-containing protein [Xanthobacteraceae bacterium]
MGGRRKTRADAAPRGKGKSKAELDLRLDARDRVGGPVDADDEPESPPRASRERQPIRSSGGSGGRSRSRSNKGADKRVKRRSFLGRLAYWGLVLGLWVGIAVIGLIAWVGAHLPPIQSLEVPKRPPSIEITGLNGRVLATRGEMGAAVPLKDLPAYLPQAFIAVEDRRFYTHHGFDPIGVMRAIVANVLHRGLSQGGSTLTQQLAKNLFLTQERTMHRKLQELVLAFWLERKYTKAQILDLYLNRVYFGAGAYGVEAAAQRYFGKSARQVTLAEAALLAGLVKSPSRLAPTRNPDGAERRAQIVLAAMADAGFVSDDAAKVALLNAPRILKQVPGGAGNYVADWVMDILNDLIGRVEQDIVVETSIDPALQAAAEKALSDELLHKGEKFGVGQGAIVAMTPEGAVRAMVGGRNYTESQFNRAVSAKRQPGSAFKPFVYLTALERGLTPDSIRDDRPIDLKGWRPENFSHEYFGPVTLTRALSLSLNTVAVRLAVELGPQSVVRTAHRLGISSRLDPNPSIALGTSEVSVVELVSAFAPFANGGGAIAPHVVDRVHTTDGKMLYRSKPANLGRIVDERHVGMMNAMMQETLLTGTARKAELPGWQAAGKTGTSQDFRDAWFIGYTSHLVTGVWLGNDDNSPTRKTTGGGLPVEIWSRFMKTAHQNVAPINLPGLGPQPSNNQFLPPAPIPDQPPVAQDSSRSRGNTSAGLDSWLMDKLFGR